MKGPVAVACYKGQWDASVDALHKALGFMPPPKYRSPAQCQAQETDHTEAPAITTDEAFARGKKNASI